MGNIKPLTKAQKTELQKLIDRAAKAHRAAFKASSALNDWCEEVYGFTPGDVDADGIIDAILGGCGESIGMSAEEFDEEMAAHNEMAARVRWGTTKGR